MLGDRAKIGQAQVTDEPPLGQQLPSSDQVGDRCVTQEVLEEGVAEDA